MPVDDLWYLKQRDPETGERLRSKRYGRGKRYRVRYTDDAGQQHAPLFEKKAAAERFDHQVHADVARGSYIDPAAGKIRFRQYWPKWLAAQTFDPSTRESVELRLRIHANPVLGDHELRALARRPSIIQAWSRGLQGQLAANYVRTVFANVSTVLTAAVVDGLIVRNPCGTESVRPPAPDKRRVQPWTAARVLAVQAGLPAAYAGTVDVGWGLGMRQGEVFGLGADDVDWLRRVVHIRRQVKIVGARLVFAPPKGGKERDVPLSDEVSLKLAAHVKAFPPQLVTLPWLEPAGKPVSVSVLFTSREHKALNRNYFNAFLWKPALVSAGVIPARPEGEKYVESREHGFHALRHTFASQLLADGVDIRTLAEYLGHTDPGFTLRVYTHLMPNAEDKARQAIDRAFRTAVDGLSCAVSVPGSQP